HFDSAPEARAGTVLQPFCRLAKRAQPITRLPAPLGPFGDAMRQLAGELPERFGRQTAGQSRDQAAARVFVPDTEGVSAEDAADQGALSDAVAGVADAVVNVLEIAEA